MPPKPEAKETAPAPAPAAAAAEVAPKGGASAVKAFLPAVLAVVLAPASCWAVAEFVLLPRMQKKLAAVVPAAEADANAHADAPQGEGKEGGKGGKEGDAKSGNPANYEFSNVVVNLAGTMGTRYLKTSFIVTAADPKGNIKTLFEAQKPKLTDITLNVLSSLTLADLEEPGAKNILREKLVAAYNQAFGKRLVEQVYFSDFVIQ
ncbi:MAG TPA: flagellar basal body-associated FliL family protein [Candidatus Didemnitutus sp.]|nr:flagellar basal body-associated FliL family protein [Candidatus Didemnitutus sp.]